MDSEEASVLVPRPQEGGEGPARGGQAPGGEGPGGSGAPGGVSRSGGRGARRVGRRWRRVVVVLVVVLVVAGALWWVVPLRFSAPASTRLEERNIITMGGAVPPFSTTNGQLTLAGLDPRVHRWVVTLRWSHTDPATGELTGAEELVQVDLGESVHIEGLGTVTLLKVNPQVLLPFLSSAPGEWSCTVNLAFDPGVSRKRRP
ncbi:hypothetical protein D4740_12565 [Actinomyces sp. 2119]|uniref:hypothetical protein n=1 Tax=Actinomyces sp. 2119 TaxID=2321393 RepID=UPI000E6D1C4C|nr:hypothetical protein [Actinomyces sp. 2119]RJF40170.1 hypothetical protein D4740_12565 [Actinomyces sp. 2119]